MTIPPDDERDDLEPPSARDGGARGFWDPPPRRPRPDWLTTASAGCAGMMMFYFIAILAALKFQAPMIALPFAGLALLGISIARVRGAEGRVLAVRVAIGVGIGALIFGGCLAMLTSGRWRIAG